MKKQSRDRRVMCRWVEKRLKEKIREDIRTHLASLPRESEEPLGLWPRQSMERYTFELGDQNRTYTFKK